MLSCGVKGLVLNRTLVFSRSECSLDVVLLWAKVINGPPTITYSVN